MTALFPYRGFFVAGLVFFVLLQVSIVGLGFSGGVAGRADFRSFYAAGYLIRCGHGDQVYDYSQAAAAQVRVPGSVGAILPFIHPAYEGLLFALLSLLSYKKAYWLFFLVNIVLLGTAVRLLLPAPEWMREIFVGLPALAAASFLPVGICLIQGQDSILFFLVMVGAYRLEKSKSELAAGMVLGLGMFRFQLVIPLVVLLCFARKWRLLSGFAAACFVVMAISMAITEPNSWMTYPRYLLAMNSGLQRESQGMAHVLYPEKMANVRGLIQLLLSARVSGRALASVTAISSIGLMAWAIRKKLPFELMVVVAVLASYYGLIHDSVLLLLPLLACQMSLSEPGFGKKLAMWILLLASPVLVFVMDIPFAALCPVYLAFLIVMAEGQSETRTNRRDMTLHAH